MSSLIVFLHGWLPFTPSKLLCLERGLIWSRRNSNACQNWVEMLSLPCPDELCAFPLQWLVLHARDLLSFPSSLPPLSRMVVFQIYLQFKLQKRNLDPLVCKPCIEDSFILGVTCTFSWIMLLSINDKWSTGAVVGGLPRGACSESCG